MPLGVCRATPTRPLMFYETIYEDREKNRENVSGLCYVYTMNEPTPEEQDAIYYALAEHWVEDMQEMLSDQCQ